MAVLWYYTSNRQQMGPISWAELCRLADAGLVRPTDLVWHEGLSDWVRAGTQGLFGQRAAQSNPATPYDAAPPAVPRGDQARLAHEDNAYRPKRRPDRKLDYYEEDDDFDTMRPRRSQGMPVGLKIGLIVGGVVVALVIVVIVAILLLRSGSGSTYDVPNGRPLIIHDTLRRTDRRDTLRKHVCKIYNVRFQANATYVIDMTSVQIDSYLRLEDPNGIPAGEDDDSGGNLNARMIYTAPQDGVYRVIATTFDGRTGQYTLSIRKN